MAKWIVYSPTLKDLDGDPFTDVPRVIITDAPEDETPDLATVKELVMHCGKFWMVTKAHEIMNCSIVKVPDQIPQKWRKKIIHWSPCQVRWFKL
jgi:hypothetical protein